MASMVSWCKIWKMPGKANNTFFSRVAGINKKNQLILYIIEISK